MLLYFRDFQSKSVQIEADLNWTLLEFKQAVYRKTDLPPHVLHLITIGSRRFPFYQYDQVTLAELSLYRDCTVSFHFGLACNDYVATVLPSGKVRYTRGYTNYSVARLKFEHADIASPEHLRVLFNGVELFNDMTMPEAGVSRNFYADKMVVEVEPNVNLFHITADRLTIDRSKPLGTGTLGPVYQGKLAGKGEAARAVAVKILKVLPSLDPANEDLQQILSDLSSLCRISTCHCESVLRLHGFIHDGDTMEIQLVMELAMQSLADVFSKLDKTAPSDSMSIAKGAFSVCQALGAMHHRALSDGTCSLHLHVTPSQVLVFNDGRLPKLSVFDMVISTKTKTLLQRMGVGAASTYAWKAPEQWSAKRPKDIRTDTYGLGAVLWSWLRGGETPWEGHDPEAVMGSLLVDQHGVIDVCGPAYRGLKAGEAIPDSADDIHKVLAEVAANCLALDPSQRPTHEQLQRVLWEATGYIECTGLFNPSVVVEPSRRQNVDIDSLYE